MKVHIWPDIWCAAHFVWSTFCVQHILCGAHLVCSSCSRRVQPSLANWLCRWESCIRRHRCSKCSIQMLEHYPKELEVRLVQSTKRIEVRAQRDPRISFLFIFSNKKCVVDANVGCPPVFGGNGGAGKDRLILTPANPSDLPFSSILVSFIFLWLWVAGWPRDHF